MVADMDLVVGVAVGFSIAVTLIIAMGAAVTYYFYRRI